MNRNAISSIAIAAITFSLSTVAAADTYSKTFAGEYGDLLTTWIKGGGDVEEVMCKESRAVTIKSGSSAKSPCARQTTEHRQSETGLYRYVYDYRVVENSDYGYIVLWSELESGARIYLVEQPPQEVLPGISNRFSKEFTDWSRDQRYSAGFTRQFQGATAKNAQGKDCLVLAGKRGQTSTLTVLTCADTLPDKKTIKAFLKTLR